MAVATIPYPVKKIRVYDRDPHATHVTGCGLRRLGFSSPSAFFGTITLMRKRFQMIPALTFMVLVVSIYVIWKVLGADDFGVVTPRALIHTRSQEVAVGIAWEDFKTLTREELCPSNEMQKLKTELWNHAMVGAGHAAYTNRFHELARQQSQRPFEKAMQIADTLTDEAIRHGSIKKNPENRGNGGEPSKDRNGKDDNKVVPRNVNPVNARNPAAAREACFKCRGIDHQKSSGPRLNRAQGPGVNRPNQALAIDGGEGRGNNDNQASLVQLAWPYFETRCRFRQAYFYTPT
uniref:Reverse transcriptase domain-containing protein n=1 Tax=Tanacetum cinerariifolium TaxID=118510 RepID=A0A699GPA8_TANCI|nr:reverse transcriptase domain-containing protein [Tanacetum cinerariifolium]